MIVPRLARGFRITPRIFWRIFSGELYHCTCTSMCCAPKNKSENSSLKPGENRTTKSLKKRPREDALGEIYHAKINHPSVKIYYWISSQISQKNYRIYRITGLMLRTRLVKCVRPTRCVRCYVYESSEICSTGRRCSTIGSLLNREAPRAPRLESSEILWMWVRTEKSGR